MSEIFIGISTPNSRIEAAIRQHGAVPVLFNDYTPNYLHDLQGLVITGNKYDVPPHLYGQDTHKETLLDESTERLDFEKTLIHHAYTHSLPLLAICGGFQLLNVLFGGTLIQHLPDHNDGSINHRQQAGTYHEPHHSVKITPGSLLHRIGGRTGAAVNSDHHQAVDKLGKGFTVNATASDGTIEGIEHSLHPFLLGLQWHPEYDASAIDARVFNTFTKAARYYKTFSAERLVA